MSGFIFGGNTGKEQSSILSYEELQRRKRAQDAVMGMALQTPRTAADGIASIGKALIWRRMNKQNTAAEKAARDDFNSQFAAIMGGGSPQPQPTAQPYTPPNSGGSPALSFNASLARTESGGNYNVTNSEGFGGKYQFGQDRLNDYNRATGSKITVADLTAGTDAAKALTENVQNWHVNDIDQRVKRDGLDKYIGQNVGGVTLTQNSLRAMAHLGGYGGMKRFLQTGGKYNPSDSNGTSLLDYAGTHAGSPAAAGQSVALGGIDPRMIEMANHPMATPGQKAILQMALQRQMQANAPIDPFKQMQMEKMQMELELMRNPQAKQTDDIVEYNFAKQNGFEGSFNDWMTQKGKSSATSINISNGPSIPEYSKLPAGYVYRRNQDGTVAIDENGAPIVVPITNGPVDVEMQEKEKKAELAHKTKSTSANIVVEDIGRAIGVIENGGFFDGTGLTGHFMKGIPGTDAFALNKYLETIKANAGFDKLQAMRDASPTGGALGQVSDKETAILQAAIGNLDQAQSAEELIYNLRRIEQIYKNIIHGPSVQATDGPTAFSQQSSIPDFSSMSDEELEAFIQQNGGQ